MDPTEIIVDMPPAEPANRAHPHTGTPLRSIHRWSCAPHRFRPQGLSRGSKLSMVRDPHDLTSLGTASSHRDRYRTPECSGAAYQQHHGLCAEVRIGQRGGVVPGWIISCNII